MCLLYFSPVIVFQSLFLKGAGICKYMYLYYKYCFISQNQFCLIWNAYCNNHIILFGLFSIQFLPHFGDVLFIQHACKKLVSFLFHTHIASFCFSYRFITFLFNQLVNRCMLVCKFLKAIFIEKKI